MSGGVVCYTSFTYSYLSRARVLLGSLRRAYPEWVVWAVMVDEPPPWVDEAAALAGFDGVLKLGDLGIPRAAAWLFKHDVVEACTAVKGAAMVHLLGLGAARVIYFDPDIAVFNRLEGLDDGSIVLTPHQLEPNEAAAAIVDNEIASLVYGVFNLGFVSVCNDADGRAFAGWWAERLYQACYDDIAAGIFTDQKYCDLAPVLFEGVHILRDPGCNVASWNLSRRRLAFDPGGTITVNGSALKFYHFTKIGGAGDVMTERYGAANTEVFEVWHWYKRRERDGRLEAIPDGYWHYGRFDNGTPIPREARLLFRTHPSLPATIDNPYATLPAWLAEHRPDLMGTRAKAGK